MARKVVADQRMPVRPSSLSALQPVDASPFRHAAGAWYIWVTILVTWLISLLPWRMWEPAPNLLLLVIAFWCVNEPQRVSLFTAFLFGLLMDVHDAGLLGAQALSFTLVAYGGVALRRRLIRFHAVVQAMHLVPVFVLGTALPRLGQAWLAGEWAGWGWLWSALLTVALWPLVDFLLTLPVRRLDDPDAGAV